MSALESIETIGRTAQDELRVVLGLLRDGEAGTAPLAPAPRLVDVKDLVDTVRASGIPVELRMEGPIVSSRRHWSCRSTGSRRRP